MEICITIGGKRHCFWIPVYEYPIVLHKGPGPVNYEALIHDATLVATIQAAANKVSDSKVSGALHNGVQAAVKAMRAHAGRALRSVQQNPPNVSFHLPFDAVAEAFTIQSLQLILQAKMQKEVADM